MRKADLVNKISEETGIPKVDTLVVIESMIKEIKNSLKEGDNVYLRGFGSFVVKTRAEKVGRNIKKNTAIVIPAHNIPSFKPSKSFVGIVKKNNKVK
ncbi:MAG: HU family DNA-binding protein [Chitinophagales bacterium]|nr:integration host factor subunit beta [Chitinophagales bacterium]